MLKTRLQNLLNTLPKDFEAALIGTPVNRFYLLDFDAHHAGTLLVLPQKMVYIIDSRYIEAAEKSITNAEVILETDAIEQVGNILQEHGVKKLYLENEISIAEYELLKKRIPGVDFDITSTLSKIIMALRQIKDEEEIARMREAQRVTDACFSHILTFINEGMREIDIMLEIEHFMRSRTFEPVAFDTISVAGPNTSLPHGMPGEYKVQKGDFITLDFGARYKGYNADMTRTIAFGEPGEEKRNIYNMVLEAHLAGIKAAKPGSIGSAVDKVARDIITGKGFGSNFGHGLGHAVGIDVHENPRFAPKNNDMIAPGMMMTVEPGCYIPGKFGCRIEDMVLITKDGCEPFPTSTKELVVIG